MTQRVALGEPEVGRARRGRIDLEKAPGSTRCGCMRICDPS